MTTKFTSAPAYAFLLTCLLVSCAKAPVDSNNDTLCANLATLSAHPFTGIVAGETIRLSADPLEGANYYWTGPGNFQSYEQNPIVSSSATYGHRGWYYVLVSSVNCTTTAFDSVYVNVKFPQGTPSCVPTDNTTTFSGGVLLGDQSYYFVSFGAGISGYEIVGNSSNGDIRISMSTYWQTHTLEDGIYYTTSNYLPEYADIDKIFISDVNQSIYWTAEADKPVYISHVGGKAKLTFCGVSFSGSFGGTLYHTTASGKITQP